MSIGLISLVASGKFRDLEKKDKTDILLKTILSNNNPQIASILTPKSLVEHQTAENEKDKVEAKLNKTAVENSILKMALKAIDDHLKSANTKIKDVAPAPDILFENLKDLIAETSADTSVGAYINEHF